MNNYWFDFIKSENEKSYFKQINEVLINKDDYFPKYEDIYNEWDPTPFKKRDIEEEFIKYVIDSSTDIPMKYNLDLDLFDFYMIPLNSFAYMMDTPSFLKSQREEFRQKILDLNKKIMACRVLSVGIQTPEEGFNFLNSLDFVDLMTFGVASVDELKKDMEVLKGI